VKQTKISTNGTKRERRQKKKIRKLKKLLKLFKKGKVKENYTLLLEDNFLLPLD